MINICVLLSLPYSYTGLSGDFQFAV